MLYEKARSRYPGVMEAILPPDKLYGKSYDFMCAEFIRQMDCLALHFDPGNAELLERVGESYHYERNLGRAWEYYAQALKADPPQELTESQRTAIMRHAPVFHLCEKEAFPLKDITAIHHPDKPLIAYNYFWEDDYDFPGDCDPSDHEQAWVEYDPADGSVTQVWSFFHSDIITTPAAAEAANAQGGQLNLYVQWGKHGTILDGAGGIQLPGRSLDEEQRITWEHVKAGGLDQEHPIKARDWPARYEGSFEEFNSFPVTLDTRGIFEKKPLMTCSRLTNAIIGRMFITYNFCAKFGWPWHATVYSLETGEK